MLDSWHDVAGIDEIENDDLIRVSVGSESIAVYNLGGQFYATSSVCTHGGACLSGGFVIGEEIECALHQGRFHIPTGAARGAPASMPLTIYPVRVEKGRIFVQLSTF